MRYVELHCKTNFSFLEGASHPDELVAQAARLGYAGIAVTDRNSLAGAVRAHVAAKEAGLKLIVGAEITMDDAGPVLLWAMNREGYGRLCQLLTRGRRQAPKGECRLSFRRCRRARRRIVDRRITAPRRRSCVGLTALARSLRGSNLRRRRAPSRDLTIHASGGLATCSPRQRRVPLVGRRRRSLP